MRRRVGVPCRLLARLMNLYHGTAPHLARLAQVPAAHVAVLARPREEQAAVVAVWLVLWSRTFFVW